MVLFTSSITPYDSGRSVPTFAPMSVHVGKIFRKLYLNSGYKMEHLMDLLGYKADKTIYKQFKSASASTKVIDKWEEVMNVSIHAMIAEQKSTGQYSLPKKEKQSPKSADPFDDRMARLEQAMDKFLERFELSMGRDVDGTN